MKKRMGLLKGAGVGIGILCVVLTGCQKTPEESAVVSKAEGQGASAIAEPLKEGETRETDIPAHWKMEELRNKDRMLICADLDMEEKQLGNLPVIEMKNHILTKEELKPLVEYFHREKNYMSVSHIQKIIMKKLFPESIIEKGFMQRLIFG